MYFAVKFSELENEINYIAQEIEQCNSIIDLVEKFPESDPFLYQKELICRSEIINFKTILLNRFHNLKNVLEILKEIDYNLSIYSEKIEIQLYGLDES